MMNNKKKILLYSFLVMLALVGWGTKDVELLDDKKLIDLSKAIEYSRPGGAWNPAEESNNVEETDVIEETEDVDEETPNSYKNDTESIEEKIIIISVRGEIITYNNSVISDIDKLERRIRTDNKEMVRFELVDDFADSQLYKKIKVLLYELDKEIGVDVIEQEEQYDK